MAAPEVAKQVSALAGAGADGLEKLAEDGIDQGRSFSPTSKWWIRGRKRAPWALCIVNCMGARWGRAVWGK